MNNYFTLEELREMLAEADIPNSGEQGGLKQTAGVQFSDGRKYNFSIQDLINHAEQKHPETGEDLYPVQHVDPKTLAHNLEGREGESKASQKKRTKNADVSHPIIGTYSPSGKIRILDGTHRLGNAIENEHDHIPIRIIPREHLDKFEVHDEDN